jgi:SUF system FeS cluster assembly, SufBD
MVYYAFLLSSPCFLFMLSYSHHHASFLCFLTLITMLPFYAFLLPSPCFLFMLPFYASFLCFLVMFSWCYYDAQMIHVGKNTKSRIVSKGISAGKSLNCYRGLVQIQPSAHNARNFSQCDSMLIGDTAGANTYPYITVHLFSLFLLYLVFFCYFFEFFYLFLFIYLFIYLFVFLLVFLFSID